MLIFYLLLIPIIYVLTKITLFLITRKYGKISYDGFSAAGFKYHSKKDIFYSSKDAWQRDFGYCYFYDLMAPLFQMIIDTEAIRFEYNNKNWLISFWKGQYGMTTGAEIGVYNTTEQNINKKTLYHKVNDDEMLDMGFTLYKKDKVIAKVHSKHWWLAIFKLGMFSKPKHLKVDLYITFPNVEMLEAFKNSFKKLGYRDKDFKIDNNTFYFMFKKPRTKKVWTRNFISDMIRQHYNKRNVKLYNKYLESSIDKNQIDDSKTTGKYILVKNFVPDILKNSKEIKITTTKKESNIVLYDNKVYSEVGHYNE